MTRIADPRCTTRETTDEIVVCADPDADTRYRQAEEFSDRPTTFKGDVPDAPDSSFAPPCLAFCITMRFGSVPEPILPYTPDRLPVVDQEYLERARKAEAQERLRQTEGADGE